MKVNEFEHAGLKVEVHVDEDGSYADPRDCDNLGVMVCSHRDYTLGDVQLPRDHGYSSIEELVEDLREYHPGASHFHKLFLLDHSGLSMRMGSMAQSREYAYACDPGGWDTSLVGVIFTTDATREACGTPEDLIDEVLASEVDEYSKWLGGEVYGYVVKRMRPAQRTVVALDTDEVLEAERYEYPEVLDSCWGFIGHDVVEGEAKASAEAHAS